MGHRLGLLPSDCRSSAGEHLPSDRTPNIYYWYYGTQTLHHFGGEDWENWYEREVLFFLPRQEANGSWTQQKTGRHEVGPVYMTSIAVVILSVPANYLPIFQR